MACKHVALSWAEIKKICLVFSVSCVKVQCEQCKRDGKISRYLCLEEIGHVRGVFDFPLSSFSLAGCSQFYLLKPNVDQTLSQRRLGGSRCLPRRSLCELRQTPGLWGRHL